MTDISDISSRLKEVERDMSAVRVSVGKIETALTHVPTNAKLLGVAVTSLVAILGALVKGYFLLGEKLAAVQAILPLAN